MAFKVSPKGSCVPLDEPTLIIFENVQREANRLLDQMNKPLLIVDGKIGIKTITAINTILGTNLAHPCSKAGNEAGSLLASLRDKANSVGANFVADPDPITRSITNPKPKVDPATKKVSYPSSSIAGIPLWLILLGGAGGAYFLMQKQKPKSKRTEAKI